MAAAAECPPQTQDFGAKQLDIFEHSRDLMLRNDVLFALEQRDALLARAACLKLEAEYPGDHALPPLELLVTTLERPDGTPFADPAEAAQALHPLAEAQDDAWLHAHILGLQPDLVFMPHGNDSNATHRHTYKSFRAIAVGGRLTLQAFLNQDAKTLGMRSDLYTGFDAALADWKVQLLRHQCSQQQRNLRTLGIGFDASVLQLNRAAAASMGLDEPYAEVFELMRFVDGVPQAHGG